MLDAIADKVIRIGDIGAGNIAKLVHNTGSIGIRHVIAEVISLGVKAGVEPAELWHALRQGAMGRSRTFDRIGPRYLQEAYEPAHFALELTAKDLRLGMELGQELGVPMRFAELCKADFDEALERGWGKLDGQVPLKLQNERAGVEIHLSVEEVQRVLDQG